MEISENPKSLKIGFHLTPHGDQRICGAEGAEKDQYETLQPIESRLAKMSEENSQAKRTPFTNQTSPLELTVEGLVFERSSGNS
jgi:hypothetical protein